MSRRRVILVSATLQGGGSERQLVEMANYWAARGLDVTFATWSSCSTRDFYELDNRVLRVGLAPQDEGGGLFENVCSTVRRVRRLRKLLSIARPTAVLSFLPETNVQTLLAGARLGLRIVVSERAHPAWDSTVPFVWGVLRRVLYPSSNCIVTQTAETAQWIRQNWRRNAVVIPNALRDLQDLTSAREPLIVAVGRLSRQKGFDLLLLAFAQIKDRFPNWQVVILGEGSEREALLRLRAQLGLGDRVTLLGQVSGVETWMARAGLVVQPSRFEGFPNAVLEAMGMGAAVISADCPAGPADLIEEGVNGRLVPVEDSAVLASVMAELMSQPDVRARLGHEASKVRQRFRQDLIMTQWEAVLLPADCKGLVDSHE